MEYAITFLEGIITFISPCLLPMLPLYLSYIAGQPTQQVLENDSKKSFLSKSNTILSAFGFICGFSITFILMGVFAGTLGRFLIRYNSIINVVSGCIIILFGLSYLGLFQLPLFKGFSKLQPNTNKQGFINAVIFGMIFSIGWTPCVGTFLGSALVMAAQSGSSFKGMIMLATYALGLGIPFLLSALFIDHLKSTFDFIKRHYKVINILSGCLLLIIGVLMVTGIYGYFLAQLSF